MHDRARSGEETRIHRIDVNGKVQAIHTTHCMGDGLLGDRFCTQSVDIAGGENSASHVLDELQFTAIDPAGYSDPDHVGLNDIGQLGNSSTVRRVIESTPGPKLVGEIQMTIHLNIAEPSLWFVLRKSPRVAEAGWVAVVVVSAQ